MKKHILGLTSLLFISGAAFADDAVVIEVFAKERSDGWSFDVTLKHPDTGWDHYADGWGVYTPDGKKLGYRTLHHPHVEEQPFTRSLGGVKIPKGFDHVFIRPHDSVHGDGEDFKVNLN